MPFHWKMAYKRVRGWTLGQSHPGQNFAEYCHPHTTIGLFFFLNQWLCRGDTLTGGTQQNFAPLPQGPTPYHFFYML